MTFSNHIDLGNLITLAGFIITLYGFHRQNTKRLFRIEFRVDLMWKRFAHRFNMPDDLDDQDKD